MSIVIPEKKIIAPERTLRHIVPMRRSNPKLPDNLDYKLKMKAAEPTGFGDLLCVEGYFGRVFRSEEGCVRDQIDEFISLYKAMCKRFDEDPAHMSYEVTSMNDFYSMLGLMACYAGDDYGWTNTDDYRVDMQIDVTLETDTEFAAKAGEPYLLINFREDSTPDRCYLDV